AARESRRPAGRSATEPARPAPVYRGVRCRPCLSPADRLTRVGHDCFPLRRCSQALFRGLLLNPVAALCNGNDPEWRRYICGTEERCIRLVIGEILIDATERVLGWIREHDHDMR